MSTWTKSFSFKRTRTFDDVIPRVVSIDIEVDPKTARIFKAAAVWPDNRPALSSDNVEHWLDLLQTEMTSTDFLVGHNILRHDLPHLLATRLEVAKCADAVIDTLWLNPLAFPENPYHHLVKHHHDGRLQAGHVNDPILDAKLVLEVLRNQITAFEKLAETSPDLLLVFHFLTTRGAGTAGFDAVFQQVRQASAPSRKAVEVSLKKVLATNACDLRTDEVLNRLGSVERAWPLAYALAWISVSGGNSVMPPWVRKQFPISADIIRELRDNDCGRPTCAWCRDKNDPDSALKRWFGFESFRPFPKDADGRPLQQCIVAGAMGGDSVLGILPTGTGKSVCYQVPALSKYEKTGALSVVVSPLVALMADQVLGLEQSGISSAVTINGMLSMPERQEALDRVRLGDAAILLIAPEQLRSTSVRSVLAQREVGLWVLDEAHCVSKWSHDFRPDYRYIGRFIREFSGDRTHAPI